MEIKALNSSSQWQDFFDRYGSGLTFLHSAQWAQFLEKTGRAVDKLGIFEKSRLQGIALIEKIKSKRGSFLFVPHGPVIEITNEHQIPKKIINLLKKYLIDIAKKEKFDFIRIAPCLENNEKNLKIFTELGFRKAPIYLHSENFWITPLDRSEEEILGQMRKTTRYLIKKAGRDGVIIEKRTDPEAIDEFIRIYKETVRRERFSGYSNEYIRQEFNCFHKTGNATVYVGKHEDKVLAAALVLFTKSSGFYHQGASIHSKIPVPYLLQWEAIREAKSRGCKFYNFWGTLIPSRTPKNWAGLTTFKTGFGGFERQFVPTQDYIISPKYFLTNAYERFLAWKRGV